MIGSGPEEDVVRADWEWNHSVRWTGQIPTQAVLDLYQSQDVCFCSRVASKGSP